VLEEEQEGIKVKQVKQVKQTEENKLWKKCRRG
jgi:hypothetical protein